MKTRWMQCGMRWCRYGNAAIAVALAGWFLIVPAVIALYFLNDPNQRTDAPPRAAFWMHRHLSARYATWAEERVKSGRAAELTVNDLVQTEWPVFGSMFYLWSTEALQDAWERNPQLAPEAPMAYAKEAVDAATELVLDPNHAKWVRDHWGDDYLHHDNAFYRMLTIGAMTVNTKLTGTTTYLPALHQAVDELAADIDASPSGLLDDYPQECYPADVVTAVACIRRADAVLGTDHSAFVERAVRGFRGRNLDPRGLPPYLAYVRSGLPKGPARGCSNSYQSLFAPEIWPEDAARWYAQYEKYYWEAGPFTAGFREYPNDIPGVEWDYQDMDAGPVVSGLGMAASAFGVGAARANGRFDHAYTLTTQMLATSWPLPNGTLLLPRVLSDTIDAPLLGEACIVYNLSRPAAAGTAHRFGGYIPLLVPCFLLALFGVGVLAMIGAYGLVRRVTPVTIPVPGLQLAIWALLVVGGVILGLAGHPLGTVVAVLLAQLVPRETPRVLRWVKNRLQARSVNGIAMPEGKWLH